jgi:hypothetical protein
MSTWLALTQNSQPHSDFLSADRGIQARCAGIRFRMPGGKAYAQGGFRANAGLPEGTYRQSHMRRRYRLSG